MQTGPTQRGPAPAGHTPAGQAQASSTPAYRSVAMLKTMATGQLLGKYPIAAAAFLIVVLISSFLQTIPLAFVDQSTLIGVIFFYLVSFIVNLLAGVVRIGVLFMSLKICCNEPLSIRDLFYGFTYQTEKIVIIQCVLSGASLLANLPASVLLIVYRSTGQYHFLILSLVFTAIGIGVYCYISLVFSQAMFLLLDFADRTPKDILRMSSVLMAGHKGRLFHLWISFIPLFLLGLFSCCIGFIWVMPYLRVALANFYMDLTQNRPPS